MPSVRSLHLSDGGVPKRAVAEAQVTTQGIAGDRQRNLKYHGGPERAVCLYSAERIAALQGEGHPIQPGDIGENVVLEGLDWDAVVPGARLRLGEEVVLEIASYTAPCQTIRRAFADERFSRISQKTNPGWSRVYARVLGEGTVRAGDAVALLSTTSSGLPGFFPPTIPT